ncbi:mitochondrial NAD transporter [Lactarius sanguifluus]|nr:mitochondrial NAD transporter [Lactarius sanguifluus]
MPSTRKKWTANSMIAGAGGGLVASIATCPLDVVKTKLQAQRATLGQADYLGISATFRDIVRHDGFRGLYRGLGPTILGYLPTWAIYFAVYDGIKTLFGEAPLGLNVPATKSERLYPAPSAKGYQPIVREHPWSLHILSAMMAGAASTICTNPFWVIKTRFMTQSRSETRYRHTLDAALTIYRSEGIRAFYRGLFPSLLGITHVAVQFPLYEKLKIVAQRHSPDRPLAAPTILFCSAVAKMTASLATYPHEVVRTRLQTQRRLLLQSGAPRKRSGIVRTTTKILQFEGWRGLYKGLSVNLIRTVPNSAVTMLTYELLMRELAVRRP